VTSFKLANVGRSDSVQKDKGPIPTLVRTDR